MFAVASVGLTWQPATLNVNVGDTIVFTIGSAHNVIQTSGTSCSSVAGGFTSGGVGATASWSYKASTPGTFNFACGVPSHCASRSPCHIFTRVFSG
eukprot:jgi/Hompol1/1033/HPOL_005499-RA